MTEQRRIGRYQILEEIASGAQGAVHRVFDPESSQVVALKVLHSSMSGDPTYIERFRREASLAASIDHPNVVKIFEVGQDGDQYFMALEFLPESLGWVIERGGQMRVEGAAQLGAQIADGLAAAHALGIVHRDVKPQNVLIGQDGTAKVTDFGIARGESLATMTATGVVMGTPHYMSPEQSRGERSEARSDIYSLGCMLYHMLAGEVPFKGEIPVAVIRQQIDEQPRRLRKLRSDLHRRLEAVVERVMAKDPGKRYQTAAAMGQALRAAVPGLANPARPPRRRPTPPPQAAAPPERAPRRPSATWTGGVANAWHRSRRRWAWAGGSFTALILLLAIAIAAIGGLSWVGVFGSTEVAGSEPPQVIGTPAASPPDIATLIQSPTSGLIVFVSDRDGDDEIYMMNADGSGQTNLTNNPSSDWHPAWSPDGAKIAFVSDRSGNSEIYVMNSDGTGQTRLTVQRASDLEPAWSPDGAKVAFVSSRDGDFEIYVMNADGTDQTNLTNNPDFDTDPTWSPDGSRLAFRSSRDGNAEIYGMYADGTGQTRLTNNRANDLAPAWSPYGAKIEVDPIDWTGIGTS